MQFTDKTNCKLSVSNARVQGRRETGAWRRHCPCSLKRGATGAEMPFC